VGSEYTNPRIDSVHKTGDAVHGVVRPDWVKMFWVSVMLSFGTVGSALTISPGAVVLFVVFTGITLCLGHSLGMHRRFIHRSYRCPRWMEILFVHLGTLVGIAGPFGMLKTHDLRDWAQRQNHCHAYFSHGKCWYQDAYWQLFCSIKLDNPPPFSLEDQIANDRVYRWMELMAANTLGNRILYAGRLGLGILGHLRSREREYCRALAHWLFCS